MVVKSFSFKPLKPFCLSSEQGLIRIRLLSLDTHWQVCEILYHAMSFKKNSNGEA